jgi:nucleotide-binding universal stress UspA family protein
LTPTARLRADTLQVAVEHQEPMMSIGSYERVACCVDLTDRSRLVQARAAEVADMAGARLTIVHVTPPPATAPSGVIPTSTTPAGAIVDMHAHLDSWIEELASRDADADAVLIESLDVGHALCEWAEEDGISLIVMGAREGGAVTKLGSTATYMARHAPCDVLIVRPD